MYTTEFLPERMRFRRLTDERKRILYSDGNLRAFAFCAGNGKGKPLVKHELETPEGIRQPNMLLRGIQLSGKAGANPFQFFLRDPLAVV